MSVYKRGSVWWISYYHNGKQIREGVSGSRREAERALEARKTDIRRGEFRHIPKRERATFEEAVRDYMIEKAEKRSIRCDESNFRKLRPFFGFKRLDQITTKDVETYRAERRKAVSGAKVNRELALLKHLFNIEIFNGRVSANPVKGVKFFPEPPRRQDKVFSPAQITLLFEAAAPHLRPILAAAFFIGVRKGDALALRPEDLDFERRIVQITMQKTDEPLEIPMHPMLEGILRGALAALEPGAPYVFMSTRLSRVTGERTHFVDIKNAFRGALKRAGLDGEGFTFHSIRHTFASTLYRIGVPLLTVSKLLGHRSVKTTERYLGVRLEEKRQAVAALSAAWEGAIPPGTITVHAQIPNSASVKCLPPAS